MSTAEYKIEEILRRLEIAESRIELLLDPPNRMWMSPQEIEHYTQGKYTAAQVIRICKQVVDRPGDLPLKIGTHIAIDDNDRGRFFRIKFPEFDRIMIELMRENVRF